jgi:hypothetical protein
VGVGVLGHFGDRMILLIIGTNLIAIVLELKLSLVL